MCGDGAMTSNIRQEVKKLKILHGDMVVGFAGAHGLCQRLVGVLEHMNPADQDFSRAHLVHQVMRGFRTLLFEQIQTELDVISKVPPQLNNSALQGALGSLLWSYRDRQGSYRLLQFNELAQPEAATDQLPFFAIGSGGAIAKPFLLFLRATVFSGRPLALADGRLAALLAQLHAIDVNPGGVAEPIQMIELSDADGIATCREVPEAELNTHRSMSESFRDHVSRFFETLAEGAGSDLPVPTPPA